MSIKGQIKEAAGYVKEEAYEHGTSPEDKAKAQEHLARLEKICGKTCDEYKSLEKSINTFTHTGTVSAYGG